MLVQPYTADGRIAAMVEFPGGYIAEIHALAKEQIPGAPSATGFATRRAGAASGPSIRPITPKES